MHKANQIGLNHSVFHKEHNIPSLSSPLSVSLSFLSLTHTHIHIHTERETDRYTHTQQYCRAEAQNLHDKRTPYREVLEQTVLWDLEEDEK